MDYEMFEAIEFLKNGEWHKAFFISYTKNCKKCAINELIGMTMVFSEVLLKNVRKPFSLSNDNPNKMFKKELSHTNSSRAKENQ